MTKNVAKSLRSFIIRACAVSFVGLLVFTFLYLLASNARDNRNSFTQETMMAILLEWGRLAPFPASATNISIETEGTSFTRSFRASFVAPKQDIQDWIKSSPGLNSTTGEGLPNNQVWYSIQPGGAANKAEVTIDYGLNKVEIYVSWG